MGATLCVIVTDTYSRTRASVFARHGFVELWLGQVTEVPSAQVQSGSVALNDADTLDGKLSTLWMVLVDGRPLPEATWLRAYSAPARA
jgi:hypothetical protein